MFILAGLYFLIKKNPGDNYYDSISVLFFFLALLSRESAICFIPLVILVYIKTGRFKIKKTLIVTLIPVIFYTLIRFISELYFNDSNINSLAGSLDFNPLKILYKMLHYFVSMFIPVKMIFAVTDYKYLEFLINAYNNPADNLLLFASLGLVVTFTCSFIAITIIRVLRKEMMFPLLFIYLSLSVYLLSFNTAERFLYLPSAGFAILLGMFFEKLKSAKTAFTISLVFILIHSVSLFCRAVDHKRAAEYSALVMNKLHESSSDLGKGNVILLDKIPPKQEGIFFLSMVNIQANWDYNFPDKKIRILFPETLTANDNKEELIKFNFKSGKNEYEIER